MRTVRGGDGDGIGNGVLVFQEAMRFADVTDGLRGSLAVGEGHSETSASTWLGVIAGAAQAPGGIVGVAQIRPIRAKTPSSTSAASIPAARTSSTLTAPSESSSSWLESVHCARVPVGRNAVPSYPVAAPRCRPAGLKPVAAVVVARPGGSVFIPSCTYRAPGSPNRILAPMTRANERNGRSQISMRSRSEVLFATFKVWGLSDRPPGRQVGRVDDPPFWRDILHRPWLPFAGSPARRARRPPDPASPSHARRESLKQRQPRRFTPALRSPKTAPFPISSSGHKPGQPEKRSLAEKA